MPLRETVTGRDHDTIAAFVVAEFQSRKRDPKRVLLEKQWKEVDRQLAMDPKPVASESNDPDEKWLPQIEMPGQAQALEINVKDAKRLVFPPTVDWYSVFARVDDEFLQSDAGTVITEQVFPNEFPMEPEQLLNTAIHATMDYVHKINRWRETWVAAFTEAYKYGTYALRWAMVEPATLGAGYRGFSGRALPTLIPVTIRNIYPDNSAQAVLQEGVAIEPATIRRWDQKTEDLRRATGEGWIKPALAGLDDQGGDKEKRDHTELVEYEGDLWIPRSRGGFYLRNHIVTVAVTGGPKLVRIREGKIPFNSYIIGYYQRDDLKSAYGTSPLLKGRVLQEMLSESANAATQTAILNAQPPVSYDSDDSELDADGGPKIAPRKIWKSENPDAIKSHQIGDAGVALSLLTGMQGLYDDLTSTSEPRRGSDPTSHTTAFAADVSASRSILRTEEFVNEQEEGAMTTALYQEYALIRRMKSLSVPVDARGVQGFVDVNPQRFPDQAEFTVHGSRGVLNRRERRENMTNLATLLANLTPLLAGNAPDTGIVWPEIVKDLILQHGITDAARYTGRSQPLPDDGTQAGPEIPAIIESLPGQGTAGA